MRACWARLSLTGALLLASAGVWAPGLAAPGLAAQEPATPEPVATQPVATEQPPAQQEGAAGEGAGGAVDREEGGPSQSDLDLIEDLLIEGEEVVEGGMAYEPGDRRDPFRSLLVVVDAPRRGGPRPEGIAGLLIEDLTITGVWVWEEGPVAQVEGASDPRSLLLRAGDRLFDGEVLSVSYSREEGAEVVFRQIVDDPTSPKPFREISRRLEP